MTVGLYAHQTLPSPKKKKLKKKPQAGEMAQLVGHLCGKYISLDLVSSTT